VEGGLLLDIVVRQGSPVLKLLSSKDQPLLIRWNTLLVLDLGLDILDGVGGLNLECDGLTGQCLDKNLHDRSLKTLCLFDPPTNMAFEMQIR